MNNKRRGRDERREEHTIRKWDRQIFFRHDDVEVMYK